MEAAGLAVGLVSLLALYKEAASTVRSVRHFSSESLRLSSRYAATKILFERWGKHIGIADGDSLDKAIHPQLEDQATASAVEDLLRAICDVLANVDSTVARYHDQNHDNSAISAVKPPGSVKSPLRSRLKWAVADSAKLSSQVHDFDDLVQQLYLLVPLEGLQQDQFRELQDALIRSQRAHALDRVTRWLDATTTENRFDAYCSARLDSTCDWVDMHSAYQGWLSDQATKSSKLLWIHGPAGFGKSVLCAYIIKTLLARNDTPVYYFFCSGDSESQKSPSFILRSWIRQAVQLDESVLDMALQHLESCQNTIATHSDLWQLLKQLMTHSPKSTFVVDGLDECPRTSTARVDLHRSRGETLNELLKVATEAQSRLLVVSRNEGDIRSQLRPHGPQPPGLELYELAITKDLVSTDVARFAEHVVVQRLPGKPGQFHKDLAAQMTEKGDGMFLWIRLQSQNLRPRKGNRQLQRTVDEMPTDLVRIYERNWNDIQNLSKFDRERAETILRWVTFAGRPLTIAELSEIVAVLEDDEDGGPQFEDLPTPFDAEYADSEVLGLCGSFLELREAGTEGGWESKTVHLIHYSADEFLSGEHDGAPFSDHVLQHYSLAQSCLTYLDHDDTWQADEDENSGIINRRPFLTYAVYWWFAHLKASQKHPNKIQMKLNSFFGVPNPNWDNWRQRYEQSLDGASKAEGSEGNGPKEGSETWGRMYYAALFGLLELVEFLHHEGVADVNEVGGSFDNPVQAAIAKGHTEMLELLLDLRADVVSQGKYGSALHVAANYNQENAILALLQHGASLSVTNADGMTPLLTAVFHGNDAIVRLLVNKGADLFVYDNDGWSALHAAAQSGNIEIVKLLLQNGADCSSPTVKGATPLQISAYYGHPNVVQALLDVGANIQATDIYGNTTLHCAARSQHDCSRITAILCDSAQCNHYKVVNLLLSYGAVLAASNDVGQTPLHIESDAGHYGMVKLLLDFGANPTVSDITGWTPLHFAASRGHHEVAKLLLDSGADLTVADNDWYTPLHVASSNGQAQMVQQLLQAGADVNLASWGGITPLQVAFKAKQEGAIRVLLDHQASLGRLDFYGKAPWQYAGADFREKIPHCKEYGILVESNQQQILRQTIQTTAKMIMPMEEKTMYVLGTLGTCLLLLHDFPSASVVLDQTIRSKLVAPNEDWDIIHFAYCDACDSSIHGARYACATCPDFDLCASCMARYTEEGFGVCVGHEFLRLPSDDWKADEQTDIYTKEFVDWLKELVLRYRIADL